MSKLSTSAQSVIDQSPSGGRCRINILMDRASPPHALDDTMRTLTAMGATDIETRPRMAMLHADAPVACLKQIAKLRQVSWIDIERSAPLEAVID